MKDKIGLGQARIKDFLLTKDNELLLITKKIIEDDYNGVLYEEFAAVNLETGYVYDYNNRLELLLESIAPKIVRVIKSNNITITEEKQSNKQ